MIETKISYKATITFHGRSERAQELILPASISNRHVAVAYMEEFIAATKKHGVNWSSYDLTETTVTTSRTSVPVAINDTLVRSGSISYLKVSLLLALKRSIANSPVVAFVRGFVR